MSNVKNYTDQGGEVTHIDGTLAFGAGAVVSGFPVSSLPAASGNGNGTVKQGAAVQDAAGETPTAAEFNALLTSLRTAGIIAPSAASES